MKVEYYRQGAARKELVQAISDITCTKAQYLFLPTRAYRIGSIRVEEFGTVECEDAHLLQKVVKVLVNLGIKPAEPVDLLEETAPETEPVETVEPEAAQDTPAFAEELAQDGPRPAEEPDEADTLTISLPDDLTEIPRQGYRGSYAVLSMTVRDLEITGLTPREVSNVIIRLRKKVLGESS